MPIAIRRGADGDASGSWPMRRSTSSTEPAELQRATQAIADALQREIAAAPEQWYSFKPMWPPDAADQEALARRAAEMQTGTGRRPRIPPRDATERGGVRCPGAGCLRPPARDRGRRVTVVRALLIRGASAIACALPEAPLVALAEAAGELWYRTTPTRAARARRNLRRIAEACARDGRGSALARRAATDPHALERLVRLAYHHAARYYLEVARTPALTPSEVIARLDLRDPRGRR